MCGNKKYLTGLTIETRIFLFCHIIELKLKRVFQNTLRQDDCVEVLNSSFLSHIYHSSPQMQTF